MKETLSLLSAVLALAAAPPYIRDIIRGNTKPERMSWFILSVLGIIAFISQLELGATWSLLFSGLDTSASLVVFILAIWHGVGGHTRLDIAALSLACTGLLVATISGRPVISLIGVILADASGVSLTIRKAYLDPASETAIGWILFGTASIFGALVVGKWEISLLLYPAYLIVANYAVPLAQTFGRLREKSVVIPD